MPAHNLGCLHAPFLEPAVAGPQGGAAATLWPPGLQFPDEQGQPGTSVVIGGDFNSLCASTSRIRLMRCGGLWLLVVSFSSPLGPKKSPPLLWKHRCESALMQNGVQDIRDVSRCMWCSGAVARIEG